MKTAPAGILIAALLLLAVPSLRAQPRTDGRVYQSGYSSIMKLGRDLRSALSSEEQGFISPQPISIETDTAPFIRLLHFQDGSEPVRGVWISAGFIDLVNHVAHAGAIEKIRPGYLRRYLSLLASSPGVPPLPDADQPAFWTETVLNEQLSNFNSIVGVVVGIKLAHHYLGHYRKYEARLSSGDAAVSIARLISAREWDQALSRGVRNALHAGCLLEGAIPFLEALAKMKNPPPWADQFLRPNTDAGGLKRTMEKLQQNFLAGEE